MYRFFTVRSVDSDTGNVILGHFSISFYGFNNVAMLLHVLCGLMGHREERDNCDFILISNPYV